MGHGNPNKVDEIVEEIVKNNKVFKLKSPIEQEKEKDSMARSINSALSVLTEEGVDLVLQDLSVDPDEKFKGFIDNVGNIDIQGITRFTATVVKTKIEEAEREGINIRINTVTNDNKEVKMSDAIISTAVISDMILNFDKLSLSEKESLVDNYIHMSSTQKREYLEAMNKEFTETFGNTSVLNETEGGKKIKDQYNFIYEVNNKIQNIIDRNSGLSDDEIYIKISNMLNEMLDGLNEDDKKIILGIKENSDNVKDMIRNFVKKQNYYNTKAKIMAALDKGDIEEFNKLKENDSELAVEIEYEYNCLKQEYIRMNNLYEEISKGQLYNTSPYEEIVENISNFYQDVALEGATKTEKQQSMCDKEAKKLEKDSKSTINEQKETEEISINTISDADLLKGELDDKVINVFPPEKVVEYLKKLKKTLSSLEEDDIKWCQITTDEGNKTNVEEAIKGVLIQNEMDEDAAEIFSKIDLNGILWSALGDSDRRQEFFEQLEQLVDQIKGSEVARDTLNQDMSESQPLPEEVSAELQAIPVALQRINCSPEDIAKGMEAYQQIIDGLSPEEIEGTQETISQTLKKAAEEVGLDGVVGDILNMMTQITFNGQIAEILKKCKVEFLNSLETLSMQGPLLDPRVYAVNPEQYAENSVVGVPTEHIDESTLKTGFSALAVDLQIAEQTIIRPEELVAADIEQRKEDQIEVSETAEHEEKNDNTENSVIKKLQKFFGVYQKARTSDSDLEEEISDLELATQKMMEDMQMQAAQNGQVVQSENKPPIKIAKDEEEFEQQ